MNEKSSEIVFVYITAENEDEAKQIGRTLLGKKLVACVNILPNIHSIYRWEEDIEEADECVMLAKTQKCNVDMVVDTVKNMHSYEIPCIIVTPIIGGLEKYLRYVTDNTRKEVNK